VGAPFGFIFWGTPEQGNWAVPGAHFLDRDEDEDNAADALL